MVKYCCVYKCGSRYSTSKEVSFYRFPKVNERFRDDKKELQKKRQIAWITAINRKTITVDKLAHLRVCSKHFMSGTSCVLRVPPLNIL